MSAIILREVYRGRAADELVLIGTDGRAVLLRGDGLTPDECIRMCSAALQVLGGAARTLETQHGPTPRGNATPGLARQPGGRPGATTAPDVALLSLHQRFTETQGWPGAAPSVRLDDTADEPVTSKAPQDSGRSASGGALSA